MDKNFKELKKFLSKEKLNITNEQFRAILYLIDNLSYSKITKAKAINNAKVKFPGVTKTFMNETLKNMGFVSKAKKEANKQYTKEIFEEKALLDKSYKNKLLK